MSEFDLLIPSAKTVPENMQNLGKLPAALYPIGNKTVLQRLYNQYAPASVGIYVVAFEEKQRFEEYLANHKSLSHIKVVSLKKLGDLGESILCGLKARNKSNSPKRVIINFGDTLVFENIEDFPENGFYYAEDVFAPTWTFFEDGKNGIENIIDKRQVNMQNENLTLQKLFVGVFSFSDSAYFQKCLENARKMEKDMDSFYKALLLYREKYPMQPVKTDTWCDIGHQEQYYNAQLGVKAREFNHITIDKNRGILTKTSSDREKFIGEVTWYIKLPKDIEYVRPRIFAYSTGYYDASVSMEYYSYYTLHELLLYSDIKAEQWRDIFKRIRFICDDFSRYTVHGQGIKEALQSMYMDKTVQRLKKIEDHEKFAAFFNHPFFVNGNEFIPLREIINRLSIAIPNTLFSTNEFTIIHGDMCFSNILVDSNNSFVKLVDPRGTFGSFDIYGDQRYELAKLLHSIEGKYDYIIEDQFELNVQKLSIDYKIKERNMSFDLHNIFMQVFDEKIGNRQSEIKLIEALLFLSMIPLHNESLRQQYVMLGTGIELLSQCIDIQTETGKADSNVS